MDHQTTPNLALPLIQGGQAQKHVTHNEALRVLDLVTHLGVEGVAAAPPPAEPGERWIVGAEPAGPWEGRAGEVAVREDGAWSFLRPRAGWIAWERGGGLRVFDGAAWTGAGSGERVDRLGVGTEADGANRLAVRGAATLLAAEEGDHRVVVNKDAPGDTASVVFQTGWSGRAEIGVAGTDDLALKVSADGAAWREALVADAATGRVRFPGGIEAVVPAEAGGGAPVGAPYVASRGEGLVTNGTGLLGTAHNFPGLAFDASLAPAGLPGAFVHRGHSALVLSGEAMPVRPDRVYRLEAAVLQDALPGDWSAHPHGERHRHYVGLAAYDTDGLPILATHHMRFRHGGADSLTTLAAPLAPGDASLRLADAAGWNESVAAAHARAITVFGYRNAGGALQDGYSRITRGGMFAPGGVDKAAGTVALAAPWPAEMGNPDDPAGVWPAGTAIANGRGGSTYKYAAFSAFVPPEAGRWYRGTGFVGGVDLSGRNEPANLPPGTAAVRLLILANHSNVPGGGGGWAATGPDHAVRLAGLSLAEVGGAAMRRRADGAVALKVPAPDFDAGTVPLVPAAPSVEAI
ncbi:uncharacterized protein DUF2793 [Hasllibacter halocynthiae]|uniref:Uncharacterized protein DUF2793 n=1 Tax=Hasllibacter halocynthiae TaxID=595589 RepID=A0A2T0X2I6_9RHOB|nr:DUF2793 domain-containing protein [Hasllibacter halocynthiae]PRY93148.1 uncharacterized protein DUF2793 [Hasllibacter halocynthiae]